MRFDTQPATPFPQNHPAASAQLRRDVKRSIEQDYPFGVQLSPAHTHYATDGKLLHPNLNIIQLGGRGCWLTGWLAGLDERILLCVPGPRRCINAHARERTRRACVYVRNRTHEIAIKIVCYDAAHRVCVCVICPRVYVTSRGELYKLNNNESSDREYASDSCVCVCM